MKWTIEHNYLSGWHVWPGGINHGPVICNTKQQAEKRIIEAVKELGPGYRLDEKRAVLYDSAIHGEIR